MSVVINATNIVIAIIIIIFDICICSLLQRQKMKLAPAGETSMKGGKPYVEVHRLNDVVLLLLLPVLLVIWLRLWSSMRMGDQ